MAFGQQASNAAIEAALAEHDKELKALQVRYEQYFIGVERREPAEERASLRRDIMSLKRENIKNTALKFRLNSLWNKLLSYERMWNRTVKEIEEGRYRRDVFKAKMRGSVSAPVKAKSGKVAHLDEAVSEPSGDKEEEATTAANGDGQAAGKPSRASPKSAGRSGGPKDLSEEKIDKLYKALLMAKRSCREDASKISREGLARSLKKSLPSLQKKHKGKNVDFKVVIKGGKAIVKAVPK